LAASSRWRVGVVARVNDGIVALRLSFAALARRERARRCSNDFF
jgi:hypothetical protein